MSILKLLFALNPKNLRLVKAAEMTPKMAQEIDSFLGKMGAVVGVGKYDLTPKQAKYWIAQRKELTKFENKLNEMRSRNKLKKKEGIETLPEADIIEFPGKWNPPEGEPFAAGGLAKLKKLYDLAKKTKSKLGKAPKTDVSKVRSKVESDKKTIQELADKDQIPVRNDTVKVKGETLDDGTPDYEYYRELLDNDEYDVVKGNETVEQLEALLKEKEDYMRYMYGQYKTGKLDPKPGEVSRSRLNFLKDKAEEAEMSGRSKIITPDEIDEFNFLEKKIKKMDLDDKVQDLNKKLTNEDIMELKDLDNDPGMFDDLFDRMFGEYELDKLKKSGRKPNANGGLATLFEER